LDVQIWRIRYLEILLSALHSQVQKPCIDAVIKTVERKKPKQNAAFKEKVVKPTIKERKNADKNGGKNFWGNPMR
jgi:hypothetical protein